jgi:hypothetical protein
MILRKSLKMNARTFLRMRSGSTRPTKIAPHNPNRDKTDDFRLPKKVKSFLFTTRFDKSIFLNWGVSYPRMSNFRNGNTMKALIALISLSLLCASCTQLKLEEIPGGDNLMSAARYICELQKDGNLPGIQPNDKGSFRSIATPLPQSFDTPEPLRLNIVYSLDRDKTALYWYTIQRPDKNATWTLVEAWRTDKHGEHREELAVNK